MKKMLSAISLGMALLFCLSGCGKYNSHYNATAFVHSNESDSAFMSFWKFEGTMVFKLKCKQAGQSLAYTAKLETGSATVYYDCGDGKTELCTVSAGDDLQDVLDELTPGTVYIIVETDGKCETGSFDFKIA